MKFVYLITAFFASTNTLRVASDTENYSSEDANKCKSEGGSYGRQGLMGFWGCVKNHSDAFKPCKSSDDCLGDCIV